MVWILAVDTSSPGGAVALVRDDAVVVDCAGDPAHSHAERLPAAIADVLAVAGLAATAIDLFAVACGPGAFTGLRVGLATVQGLALALDRPTAGVSSLAAVAWRAFDATPALTTCGVWLDGARGDVFAAAYERPTGADTSWPPVEITAATVATPAETLRQWQAVVPADAPLLLGPGGSRHRAAAESRRVVVAETPLAAAVGRIGGRLHAAGQTTPPHGLAPVYVRRPDAEVERDRRRAAGATAG